MKKPLTMLGAFSFSVLRSEKRAFSISTKKHYNMTKEAPKWIIKKGEFKGFTQSSLKEDGTVWYTDGLTFDEYNKLNGGNFITITDKELDKLLAEYNNSLITKWEEITKKDYWDLLECLPPIYKGRFWFCPEASYGSIHACNIEYNGKYYQSSQCKFTSETDLLAQFKKDISTSKS